jgi:hypothetical protein
VRQQWEKIPEPWRQRWWILALLLVVFSEFRRWRVAWYTMVVSLVVEAYRFVKRCQIEPPESFGWNLGAPGDTPLSPEEYDEDWRKQEAKRAALLAAQADMQKTMKEELDKQIAEHGENFEDKQLELLQEEEENRPLEDWELEEQREEEEARKKEEQRLQDEEDARWDDDPSTEGISQTRESKEKYGG